MSKNGHKVFGRDEIRAYRLRTGEVDDPDHGAAFRVRELTGLQRDMYEYEASRRADEATARGPLATPDTRRVRAIMAARTLVDAADLPLYPEVGDLPAEKIPEEIVAEIQRHLGGGILDRVFDKALVLSGMSFKLPAEEPEPLKNDPGG